MYGSNPTCPVLGNGPGNYSCQQAILPYEYPNGTIVEEPILTSCRNTSAFLCAQGSPSFATGNLAIASLISMFNDSGETSCANAMQSWLCYIYFPPCNTTVTTLYNQLCYSTCLSLLETCFSSTSANATCYNLAYDGPSPGSLFPVAKIGDLNCVASYTPQPRPKSYSYEYPFPSKALLHYLKKTGEIMKEMQQVIPMAEKGEETAIPLSLAAPSSSSSNHQSHSRPATSEEIKDFHKKYCDFMWRIGNYSDYFDHCVYAPYLKFTPDGIPPYSNLVTTNCTTGAGSQNQSIVMFTDPYRGVLTLQTNNQGAVTVFAGSDDETQLLNPQWIKTACGSYMFNISFPGLNPPQPLMYNVNCSDSPKYFYEIVTTAVFGSNAATVLVNSEILFEGYSTTTALQTSPFITEAYCSYLYTAAAPGAFVISLNGQSGEVTITSTSLAVTNPSTGVIDLEGLQISVGSTTFYGNELIAFMSDSNIALTSATVPYSPYIKFSIPQIVNTLQAAGVNYTNVVTLTSASSAILITNGVSGPVLNLNLNATQGNVSSINGQSGAITLANGTGIQIIEAGNTFTFKNTGVLSMNTLTGTVQINSSTLPIKTIGQSIDIEGVSGFGLGLGGDYLTGNVTFLPDPDTGAGISLDQVDLTSTFYIGLNDDVVYAGYSPANHTAGLIPVTTGNLTYYQWLPQSSIVGSLNGLSLNKALFINSSTLTVGSGGGNTVFLNVPSTYASSVGLTANEIPIVSSISPGTWDYINIDQLAVTSVYTEFDSTPRTGNIQFRSSSGDLNLETGVDSGDTVLDINLASPIPSPSEILSTAWAPSPYFIPPTIFEYVWRPAQINGSDLPPSTTECPWSTTQINSGYYGKTGDTCWMIFQDAGPYGIIPASSFEECGLGDSLQHVLYLYENDGVTLFQLPSACTGDVNEVPPTGWNSGTYSNQNPAFLIPTAASQDGVHQAEVWNTIAVVTTKAALAAMDAVFSLLDCGGCSAVINAVVEFFHGGSGNVASPENAAIMLTIDLDGYVSISGNTGNPGMSAGAIDNEYNLRMPYATWSSFEWVGNFHGVAPLHHENQGAGHPTSDSPPQFKFKGKIIIIIYWLEC